jgi:hypothetical protein
VAAAERSASKKIMCWVDDIQTTPKLEIFWCFTRANVCVEIYRVDAGRLRIRLTVSCHGATRWVNKGATCLFNQACCASSHGTTGSHFANSQTVRSLKPRVLQTIRHVIHYINAILRRTLRPGIFQVGSEEGEARRDKGAGEGQ